MRTPRTPPPLTPTALAENAAFLAELARTANVRLAAQRAGVARRTVQRRRDRHPDFARAWDAAVADAIVHLTQAPPDPSPARSTRHTSIRTKGGETILMRRADGTPQIRRAMAGRLNRTAEQTFLAALAATCNVRLAAAAVNTQPNHFYQRRRQDPGFAREWRLALQQGYATLEAALIEGFTVDAHVDDAWRHNEPPALPPMTTAQALQLMYLHQKEARLLAEPPHLKRRRGEPHAAHAARLAGMHQEWLRREREAHDIAQAERRADAKARRKRTPRQPPPPVVLPDLAQVTGWSRADPTRTPHGPAALFGGWRVEDMSEEDRERGQGW
jgi:hypothetical protein